MSQSSSISVERSTLSSQELPPSMLPTLIGGLPGFVLKKTSWQVMLANSMGQVPRKFWNTLVPTDSVFWSREYLQALEQEMPEHMEVRYLLFVHNRELVAASMIQLIDLKLENLGASLESKWRKRFLTWLPGIFTRRKGESVLRIMMAGDVFHTGAPGIVTQPDVELKVALESLSRSMRWLEKRESKEGRLALQVVKDFVRDPAQSTDALMQNGYYELQAEPEMNLEFREGWNSFDDYLASMTSKYRQRARSARKKGKALTTRTLTGDEVEAACPELQTLLDAVMDNSAFRLASDDITHYCRLKKLLGDRYVFRVYELEGKIIGFSTYLLDKQTLVAHRVGIDYSRNSELKLYQNMLYDFIQAAFDEGCKGVHFGRTALEIKSTVGAEPQSLTFYLRHPRFWMNAIVKPFLGIVSQTEWEQRRPFKEYASLPQEVSEVTAVAKVEDAEEHSCPIHKYCSIQSLLKTIFSCPKSRS